MFWRVKGRAVVEFAFEHNGFGIFLKAALVAVDLINDEVDGGSGGVGEILDHTGVVSPGFREVQNGHTDIVGNSVAAFDEPCFNGIGGRGVGN